MESEEYNPTNQGFIHFDPSTNSNSESNTSSINIPLAANASIFNRKARGMDKNVIRIRPTILNAYQAKFADSLVRQKDLKTGFMDFISPVDNAIDMVYIAQHAKNFDPEWLQQSLLYVANLPIRDRFMLRAYTRNGDKLINTLIRNPAEFENDFRAMELVKRCIINNANNVIAVQIFEDNGIDVGSTIQILGRKGHPGINGDGLQYLIENTSTLTIDKIKEYIIQLAYEIKRIIGNAPHLTKKIRLFRGISEDYVKKSENSSSNECVLQGFQSMSYSLTSALGFSSEYNENNMQTHHMLYSVLVHPGVPCIAVETLSHFPEEAEVILDMNLACSFDSQFYEKVQLTPSMYNFAEIANGFTAYPTDSVYVKHLRIAPLLFGRNARANNMNSLSNVNNSRENLASHVSNALTNLSSATNEPMSNSQINVAMHQYGFNGYGGCHRGGRATLIANLNRSRNFGKTLKRNNLRKNKPRVNTAKNNRMIGVNRNKNTSKNVRTLMKEIEAIEAAENDYTKVRDRGLGFVIVKGAKVPEASRKLLEEMKRSE